MSLKQKRRKCIKDASSYDADAWHHHHQPHQQQHRSIIKQKNNEDIKNLSPNLNVLRLFVVELQARTDRHEEIDRRTDGRRECIMRRPWWWFAQCKALPWQIIVLNIRNQMCREWTLINGANAFTVLDILKICFCFQKNKNMHSATVKFLYFDGAHPVTYLYPTCCCNNGTRPRFSDLLISSV